MFAMGSVLAGAGVLLTGLLILLFGAAAHAEGSGGVMLGVRAIGLQAPPDRVFGVGTRVEP